MSAATPQPDRQREGPTVYLQLLNDATDEGIAGLREQIENRVAHTAALLANDLAEIVRRAYVEGVRDGYVQGIAAAETKKP